MSGSITKFLSFACVLLASAPAWSGEGDRPFSLFAGAGTGYGYVSGNDYVQNPGGAHVLLSGLAAFQLSRWELDAGMSWLYSNVNGQNVDQLPIRLRTRAGTLDLGARYRLGSRWQLGPAINFAFGTDVGFGPAVGASQSALLIGGKAIYEIVSGSVPVRLWSQLSTDVGGDRRFVVGLAGIQVGIPVRIRHDDVSADAIQFASAAPEREVKIVLDPQKVFFNTNSNALKKDVKEILQDVGRLMSGDANREASVRIFGHADQRGRYAYNLKLSKKRAESVQQALMSGGVSADAMQVSAHSYSLPLDPANNKAAWAKNRRVELVFKDVSDPAALRNKLQPLSMDVPREER